MQATGTGLTTTCRHSGFKAGKEEKEDANVSQSYCVSLIADQMSWLDEQGKKKEFDKPRQEKIEDVQKGLADEKVT